MGLIRGQFDDESYSLLLDAVSNGAQSSIWIVDREFNLLFFNDTFFKNCQIAFNRVPEIGKPIPVDKNSINREVWHTYYQRVMNGETFYVDIEEMMGVVQSYYRCFLKPLISSSGSTIGVVVSAEDTSAFNKAIQQLRGDERKLESILDNTVDIIMLMDRDMHVLHFNHGLSAIIEARWDIKMERGMNVCDLLEPKYAEMQIALYKRGLSGERFTKIEEYVNQDGNPVFIETSYNPVIDDDGSVNSLAVHSRDITTRMQSELNLIASKERAEELNILKTNFLANMSHEIRTPINGILGLAEIMADETDIENIKEYTHHLRQSGRRLLNTITSILDISKLEAEGTPVHLEPIYIEEVIRDVMDLLSPIAESKKIYLDVKTDDPNMRILADHSMLNQILNNVIGNAVKFTSNGGVIVHTGIIRDGHFVQIMVSDTGIGISEEFLPRVFDAFEQESSGTRRSFEGSGLGLSITKKIVTLLGGNILVESKKNEGTTFRIQFPLFRRDL